MKKVNILHFFMGSILACSMGFGLYYIKTESDKQKRDQTIIAEMQEDAEVKTEPVNNNNIWGGIDESLLKRIDFDSLKSVNKDVESWLYVNGTNINQAIMREPVVDEYKYDLRDWKGRRNTAGSFLFPALPKNSKGETPDDAHQLVLGHKMVGYNGEKDWQFSKLPSRWGALNGATSYPYVYKYYPDHSERWRVWAAVDLWGDDIVYDQPYELGSSEYENLINHIKDTCRYETPVKVDKNTRTLMLSTCNNPNGRALKRFVLVCVPDANYYYDTKEYVDINDKKAFDEWKLADKK